MLIYVLLGIIIGILFVSQIIVIKLMYRFVFERNESDYLFCKDISVIKSLLLSIIDILKK